MIFKPKKQTKGSFKVEAYQTIDIPHCYAHVSVWVTSYDKADRLIKWLESYKAWAQENDSRMIKRKKRND